MQPGPGINIVCGDNASGKTTLLEAIHIIGRGRSFRFSAPKEMTRQGGDPLSLQARILNEHGVSHRIGAIETRNKLQYKLDGLDSTSRFDLVTTVPLQLIDPNVHRLFEQGPRFRRAFLDWGVFHVEQRFFPAWREYRRALRQRNKALRNQQPTPDVTAWDGELARAARIIHGCRKQYVERLVAALPEALGRLLGGEPPAVHYDPGWRHRDGFEAALRASLAVDRRSGFTHPGPHRADLVVGVAGVRAGAHVSRGQQKALATTLLLTQARILRDEKQVSPVLLADDLGAELGPEYQSALLGEIERLDCQCFATFVDSRVARSYCPHANMFHVEQGMIAPG